MAGLVPAIHVFLTLASRTWMPGTSPGMTAREAGELPLRERLLDHELRRLAVIAFDKTLAVQ